MASGCGRSAKGRRRTDPIIATRMAPGFASRLSRERGYRRFHTFEMLGRLRRPLRPEGSTAHARCSSLRRTAPQPLPRRDTPRPAILQPKGSLLGRTICSPSEFHTMGLPWATRASHDERRPVRSSRTAPSSLSFERPRERAFPTPRRTGSIRRPLQDAIPTSLLHPTRNRTASIRLHDPPTESLDSSSPFLLGSSPTAIYGVRQDGCSNPSNQASSRHRGSEIALQTQFRPRRRITHSIRHGLYEKYTWISTLYFTISPTSRMAPG